MRRICYDSYGGPEVMKLQEFTPAAPGPQEVVVTVKAASINPIDWKIRRGDMRQASGETFPRAMGSEFAGVVSRVGSAVVDFQPGDEVVGSTTFARQGSFAEAVVTSETLLARKPPSLSFVDATGVASVGVTAWLALVKTASLKAGQRVLINGALGGVGQAAVTLADSLGAHTTGRVGPLSMLEADVLGVDCVLDYTQPIPEGLMAAFDVVFDVNGSLTPEDSGALVKPTGVVVDINPTEAKMRAVQSSDRHKMVFAAVSRENLETVLDLAAHGRLRTQVNHVVSIDEAIPLIAAMEGGRRVSGKSVIAFA